MPPLILHIAIQKPLKHSFDYLAPPETGPTTLRPGIRVKVPFGKKELIGILLKADYQTCIPLDKIRAVTAILDVEPLLPADFLTFCQWTANYYHYSIGEILLTSLPTQLRREDSKAIAPTDTPPLQALLKQTPLSLNPAQQAAVEKITQSTGFQTFLLSGVTGSGKTEVYLQAITPYLQQGKQVLILVPEIGLTPQTIARFEARFATPIAVLHSALTPKARLKAWQAAQSGEALILIGTRSAIFVPLPKLGMIILDEEHDLSFKQQTQLKYSARDLALVRAQQLNIPVILGSATPTLESLQNAKLQRYQELRLPERAGNANPPTFHLVDLRNQFLTHGLSKPLLAAIQQHLAAGNQVLLFLNRRGYAPVLLCHSCGWSAQCRRCDARLTLHQQPSRLICHHCSGIYGVPTQCEQCKAGLVNIGVGTEQLEAGLKLHFADTPIVRIDRDTVRNKNALDQLLGQIQNGQRQILIGTQMLAKGHHFPNVTLVGIIEMDTALYSTDFRANERLGQLIMQVAGRAGRAEKPGQVYLQTHHPNHPLIQILLRDGYHAFAAQLLAERASAQWPPFHYQALIRAEAKQPKKSLAFLTQIKSLSHQLSSLGIKLAGPVPAPMERKAGQFRALLLLQTTERKLLQQALQILMPQISALKSRVRWSLDVDPQEMF